jgi:N-acetylneuraminic acid mutarotase
MGKHFLCVVITIILVFAVQACSSKRNPTEVVNEIVQTYIQTNTPTQAVTFTPTQTPPPGSTNTNTRTYTNTYTHTNTFTYTETQTPSITNTYTITPGGPTLTPTNTPMPGQKWILLTQYGWFVYGVVNFNNAIWGVCHDGAAYSTTNGSWTTRLGSFPTGGNNRAYHTTTVFNNKIWCTGGYYFDTNDNKKFTADVYSNDGISGTWTSVTKSAEFGTRSDHTCVEFNGKLWVIGGRSWDYPDAWRSTIYSSSDGQVWTLETTQAFSGRENHACVVYDNKIWVIGGILNLQTKGDVWSSPDGINWTQVTAAAAFGVRRYHTVMVFDNKMWLIGGQANGSAKYHDVWNSTDGVTWNLVTDTPEFGERYLHGSTVFDNRMWVVGGMSGTTLTNEMWYSY